jgi:aryl-alcohol dehydrogenase-like predicted oxidoreductase
MQKTTKLGATGPEILPFALGCMGMAGGNAYGPSDDAESIATIHEALERGVSLLDTGDFYGMGRNELLVGQALRGKRDRAILSVKYGAQRGPDGAFLGVDTGPIATKTALTYSLARLGVDHVDIYRPARLDPRVPIEDTIGAIAELVKQGYVRHIGLSEVGADTIRRAAKVHPIVDLQMEYAIVTRGAETAILPALAELGIGMTAYGVLSRGLLTGSRPQSPKDMRAHLPRFTGENGEKNARLVAALATMAKGKGVTPAQLAIAWAKKKGEMLGVAIVPTLGARTRAQLADGLAYLDVTLDAAEVTALEASVPASEIAGLRYPAPMMAHLDSEDRSHT